MTGVLFGPAGQQARKIAGQLLQAKNTVLTDN
jgi:hypothetical protein